MHRQSNVLISLSFSSKVVYAIFLFSREKFDARFFHCERGKRIIVGAIKFSRTLMMTVKHVVLEKCFSRSSHGQFPWGKFFFRTTRVGTRNVVTVLTHSFDPWVMACSVWPSVGFISLIGRRIYWCITCQTSISLFARELRIAHYVTQMYAISITFFCEI